MEYRAVASYDYEQRREERLRFGGSRPRAELHDSKVWMLLQEIGHKGKNDVQVHK